MAAAEDIAAALRRRIRAGRWAPRERLPTVRALAAEFDASVPTAARAVAALAAEGFVVADGRRGTRVAARPPHRHRFALVLPSAADGRGRYPTLRLQALADAARDVADDGLALEVFHAISEHPEPPEHRRLAAAARDGALAGVIAAPPRRSDAWLDAARSRVPMIGGPPHPDHPERGAVALDPADFRRAALAACARAGRRRLAALFDATPAGYAESVRLRAAVAELGLDCPPHRVLAAPAAAPDWARPAVAALMRGERPDALIVADDDLLVDALAALDAAGVGDDEVLVIALAHFPLSPPPGMSPRPVLRLGWDQREFLRAAIEALAGWIERRTPPGERALPVRGDDAPRTTPAP